MVKQTPTYQLFLLFVLAWLLGGISCQAPDAGGVRLVSQEPQARALLSLEQIGPAPQFPAELPAARHEPAKQAVRYLQTGRKRFDERLWADALTALEKALQIDPQLAQARVLLARACIQHGNYGLAQSHLEEALKSRPRDAQVHQLLGEIALQERRFDDAIASLWLALTAAADDPNRPERVLANLSLALALKEAGYTAASAAQLEAYLRAVEKPTDQMQRHHELKEIMALYRGKAAAMLGDLQAELGRHDKAVLAYRQASAEAPDDESLETRLISALAAAGQHVEALERLHRLLERAPADSQKLALLRKICDLSGHAAQFDDEILRLAQEAEQPADRFELAKMLVERGRRSEAVQVLVDLVAEHADQPDAAFLLAKLWLDGGLAPKAFDILCQVLEQRPETYPRAEAALAEASSEARGAELLVQAKDYAASRDDEAIAHFILGCILQHGGDQPAALVEFRAALEKDAPFAPASIPLARLAVAGKHWQEALSALQEAIAADLKSSEVFLLKGKAHEALDETEDAQDAFLESFRLDGKTPLALYCLAEASERRGELLRAEQLYRRILDDVDPKFAAARERLVRLLTNNQKLDKARVYFSDFERLDQSGPPRARCQALLDLATSRNPDGARRLEDYRDALRGIREDYPGEAATEVDLAMSYEATGDYAEALRHAAAALAIDPEDRSARERKANYQARLLDFAAAAATVRGLREDRPNDLSYQQRLVELALVQCEFDEAARLLEKLSGRRDLKEARSVFVNQRVQVLKQAKRYQDAVAAAKDWLDESPDDLARREIYLDALRASDKGDEALAAARDWLSDDPTNPDLREQFIRELRETGRFIEAEQRILGWLAADADDYELNSLLIGVFWAAKDWHGAIEAAQTGAEVAEHRNRFQRLLGISFWRARRYEEAVETYRKLAEGDGGIVAIESLIRVLIEAERYAEAEQEINSLLTPEVALHQSGAQHDARLIVVLRNYLVQVYQLTRRAQQAIGQLEEMLAMAPKDQGINNDLGYTLADEGIRLDEAERMIRLAVGEEPVNAAYLDSLGWVFYKRGRFEDAEVYLRRAVTLSLREEPVLHDHLADALYRLGRVDEARTQWQTALKLSQGDSDAPPDDEKDRVRDQVTKKLHALEKGRPVPTAPLARSAESRPRDAD